MVNKVKVGEIMKIALLMENSQASKNEIIAKQLYKVAEHHNYTFYNLGMKNEQDTHLTYIQLGILSAILLNSKAVDFIVTGCGTGQGAMMALNMFPGVTCGHITNPSDAFLFTQINAGNAVSLPYAQGFGWGGELNALFTFEKLFEFPLGNGYPVERAHIQQCNAKILDKIKKDITPDLIESLKRIDQELLKSAISSHAFQQVFFENAQDEDIKNYIKSLI